MASKARVDQVRGEFNPFIGNHKSLSFGTDPGVSPNKYIFATGMDWLTNFVDQTLISMLDASSSGMFSGSVSATPARMTFLNTGREGRLLWPMGRRVLQIFAPRRTSSHDRSPLGVLQKGRLRSGGNATVDEISDIFQSVLP